jgi:hypothetical protein
MNFRDVETGKRATVLSSTDNTIMVGDEILRTVNLNEGGNKVIGVFNGGDFYIDDGEDNVEVGVYMRPSELNAGDTFKWQRTENSKNDAIVTRKDSIYFFYRYPNWPQSPQQEFSVTLSYKNVLLIKKAEQKSLTFGDLEIGEKFKAYGNTLVKMGTQNIELNGFDGVAYFENTYQAVRYFNITEVERV